MSTTQLPFGAVRVTRHPLGSDRTSDLLNHWSLGGHASAEHCFPTHPVAFSESGWTPVSWWVMTSTWAHRPIPPPNYSHKAATPQVMLQEV